MILLNAAALLKYYSCDHYQAFVSDFFFHLRVALVLRFLIKQMIYKKTYSPVLQGAGAAERHVLK